MDMMTSLVIGISSSIVATVILMIISAFVIRIMIPWSADIIYHGVRIDGEWEMKGINGKDYEDKKQKLTFNLRLKQKSNKISGSIFASFKKNDNDDADIAEYVLDGKIRDMYFLATAVPISNRHIDGTSLLLHICHDNSQLIMQGGILVEDKPGVIVCHEDIKFSWKNS